jgi:hypothetical protein
VEGCYMFAALLHDTSGASTRSLALRMIQFESPTHNAMSGAKKEDIEKATYGDIVVQSSAVGPADTYVSIVAGRKAARIRLADSALQTRVCGATASRRSDRLRSGYCLMHPWHIAIVAAQLSATLPATRRSISTYEIHPVDPKRPRLRREKVRRTERCLAPKVLLLERTEVVLLREYQADGRSG